MFLFFSFLFFLVYSNFILNNCLLLWPGLVNWQLKSTGGQLLFTPLFPRFLILVLQMTEPGRVAQWIRTLAAFAEDLG